MMCVHTSERLLRKEASKAVPGSDFLRNLAWSAARCSEEGWGGVVRGRVGWGEVGGLMRL